jgi:hypothetical protein
MPSALHPQLLKIETRIERASCWFIGSGIQQQDGGVARIYNTDLELSAPVSTEITGYAISALVYAYRRSGSAECLDRARRAASFLMEHAWDPALRMFVFELQRDGHPLRAYFFDSGIIVRGLLALWRETGDGRLLDAAVNGGFAMREFAEGNVIHPILDLPSREPLAHQPAWSRGPGCYQLKSAMAWRDLFSITGEALFAEAYERVLQIALRSEAEFLPAPDGPDRTMDRLHAYCYFLEGLLPVASRPEAAAALQGGIEKVSRYLREMEPQFVRSDVYAQLLRVRLFAEALAGITMQTDAALEEATRMTVFQSFEHDPRRAGGFYFGRKGDNLMPFVNPVSTAFCMQALELWDDYQDRVFRADLASLI